MEVQEKQLSLRGGEFIVKDSDPSDVFIPEDFTEEQRMIQQTCLDFVKEIGDRAHKLEEQAALLEEAGELGLLGCHMPEQYGGMQLDGNTNTLIAEALGADGGAGSFAGSRGKSAQAQAGRRRAVIRRSEGHIARAPGARARRPSRRYAAGRSGGIPAESVTRVPLGRP